MACWLTEKVGNIWWKACWRGFSVSRSIMEEKFDFNAEPGNLFGWLNAICWGWAFSNDGMEEKISKSIRSWHSWNAGRTSKMKEITINRKSWIPLYFLFISKYRKALMIDELAKIQESRRSRAGGSPELPDLTKFETKPGTTNAIRFMSPCKFKKFNPRKRPALWGRSSAIYFRLLMLSVHFSNPKIRFPQVCSKIIRDSK